MNFCSPRTPPFSSEEEVEENDIRHSYISPELSLHKASKGHSKDNVPRFAYRSDINMPEDEVDLKPSRSRSTKANYVGSIWGKAKNMWHSWGRRNCLIKIGKLKQMNRVRELKNNI